MFDNELLRPTDLEDRTHQWLKELIQNQRLQNITLILAGRGVEGQSFFTSIKDAIKNTNGTIQPRELIDINLVPLTPTETRAYFQQLAQDWHTLKNPIVDQITSQRIAQQFQAIASEKIGLMSCGCIPLEFLFVWPCMRRSLLQGEKFQNHYATRLRRQLKKREQMTPTIQLPLYCSCSGQLKINLLIYCFATPQICKRVLQALVRAPRGLSAEQLHFVLDNKR
ncbi:MAG: hypothetical protein IPM76_19830 [Chloroflexi bacterium]|nr:hypothetical protein [Chloroflexota bacterium]